MNKVFKPFIFLAFVFATFAMAGKSKIIWIDEPEETISSNRELRRRVARLEKAVRQLQKRVFELEYDRDRVETPEEKEKRYTCYIETPFDGLISETRPSLTEAKTAAVKACNQKTNSGIKCKMENVKCGE